MIFHKCQISNKHRQVDMPLKSINLINENKENLIKEKFYIKFLS